MWHATPRPKNPQDLALIYQLVPESKPQRRRVPIFCKVGCLAIVATDSHPSETQTIFLVLIFYLFFVYRGSGLGVYGARLACGRSWVRIVPGTNQKKIRNKKQNYRLGFRLV